MTWDWASRSEFSLDDKAYMAQGARPVHVIFLSLNPSTECLRDDGRKGRSGEQVRENRLVGCTAHTFTLACGPDTVVHGDQQIGLASFEWSDFLIFKEIVMNTVEEAPVAAASQREIRCFEEPVNVKTAARFLGVSPSLVYSYVERKQIPHFRIMGRAIRFSISELEKWRQQFFVNGGIDE